MLALARYWLTLFGGVAIGAGLVLHGQIMFAAHCREEVQDTFFLWRGIGQLTFVFQDDETQLGLWLNEVPDEVMVESDRAAWTLILVGTIFAVAALGCRRRRQRSPRPRAMPRRRRRAS